MDIPAAINDKSYKLPADVADGYQCGPAALVAIDSKLSNGVYVLRFAPVADTVSGVDESAAFWDVWSEVVEVQS